MYLAKNKWGYILLDFIKITETEMLVNKLYKPITGALILVECNSKYLIGFNRWRNQWEMPAGGIEYGETPRECVERELFEETNQKVTNIEFKGIFKLYDENKDIIKYQAMYYACIDELKEFVKNNEIYKIMLWDLQSTIKEFDEVDRKMIELCLR
ncbi:NUDIX hydrolase [Clostridium senegalense]|uniref:NUDIX hydrolase n=1 Tax=Clostridium senegalense TaxID=1465809 RepID=UPI00028849E2|nr:NUDIX hydrolase [Clostridium senegalense]